MVKLDLEGWNKAGWNGTFAHLHTDDVYVHMKGMAPTQGIGEHIAAMEGYVAMVGGAFHRSSITQSSTRGDVAVRWSPRSASDGGLSNR